MVLAPLELTLKEIRLWPPISMLHLPEATQNGTLPQFRLEVALLLLP